MDKILLCQCNSIEHQIIWSHDPDDTTTPVYVNIYLAKHNFVQRVVCGLKYIFGYKCKYGHWDEILLDKNKIEELKILCENALK